MGGQQGVAAAAAGVRAGDSGGCDDRRVGARGCPCCWCAASQVPARSTFQTHSDAYAQVTTLSISTLLTHMPPALRASHQASALVLFMLVLTMAHWVRPAAPTRAAQLVAKLLPAATAAAATV